MKFIGGHAFLNFLSPVDTSLYGLKNFLELVSAALFRVGQRVGFSSHILLVFPSWLAICLGWVCLFVQSSFRHLGFLEKSWVLYSVLEDSPSIFDFRCFLEQAPKLPANFLSLSISARAAEVFLPSDLFVNLRSCPKVVYIRPLVWRCSLQVIVDSCPLLYLYGRGSKVLGRTASRLWAMSWEVFSLPSIFLVLWRRRDQWDILPSLWWNLFFYPYFLMFYE